MPIQTSQKIIEECILSPGLSKASQAKALELFRTHLDFILKHADIILKTPELFHCTIPQAVIGAAYMGSYPGPLGVLLRLWQDDTLTDTCEQCGGKLYIFTAGGSPLSGRNKCSGICRECKNISSKGLPSFGPIMTALRQVKTNQNKRIVLRTKGQFFSFKHGLSGNPTPDKVLDPGVTPFNIEELLSRLKEHGNNKS